VQLNITLTLDAGFTNGTIENIINITFFNESGDQENDTVPGENLTITTIVNDTNLTVTKTFNEVDKIVNGSFYNYTIDITNPGPDNATDVTVFENFNDSVITFISSNPINTSVNDWNLGNLTVGESVQLNITVQVNPNFTNGLIENIINITFNNQNQTQPGDNVTIYNGSNLSVDKTASSATVSPGSTYNYTINITNEGPGNATNIIVFENFNDSLITFVSSKPVNTSINDWALGNLTPGSFVQLNITVLVNASAADGDIIENIINITYTNDSGGQQNQTQPGDNVTVTINKK